MELTILHRPITVPLEVVERKGRGHPDTLTDGLAEELSVRYCLYTRERFGSVLHHNFDKVGLLGGASDARLGDGRMLAPIRVLLNGRASARFGDEVIPLEALLREWATAFLTRELPMLDPNRHLMFHYNVSGANTAGYPAVDFSPRSQVDLYQAQQMLSSDTTTICIQYPPTPVERMVLAVEQHLTSDNHREGRPWLGSDIKIMACGTATCISITACVPQIAAFVTDLSAYRANLEMVRADIQALVELHLPDIRVDLRLNTLDDYERGSLYLTVLGSCIESGDEGMVGRGNRPSGFISVLQPFSGEAACGKNPVFFPGKVYTAAGKEIARRLHEATGARIDVWLMSQEGRPLADPWKVIVWHEGGSVTEGVVRETLTDILSRIPALTEAMLRREVRLC
jgi:S-adenosylmethionine synthetase